MHGIYLDACGLAEAVPGELDPQEILAARFARLPLGGFDVRFPAAELADKDRQDDLRAVVHALLDAQVQWLDWVAPKSKDADVKADHRPDTGRGPALSSQAASHGEADLRASWR